MKALLITLIAVFTICLSVSVHGNTPDLVSTKTLEPIKAYYGPSVALRVEILSEKGVLSVLEVPKGVFLNVESFIEGRPSQEPLSEVPYTFHGDITIRTRRADEMAENESRDGDAIMSKSPLQIELKNATVTVEVVEK